MIHPETILPSRWQQLHERGVVLADQEINFITDHIVAGANEALRYLEQASNGWPKVIFSDDMDTIGYALEQESINIPVPYLNKMARVEQPFMEHQQIMYIIDGVPVLVPYAKYLKLAGREETIHHFQKKGHPRLHAHPSIISPASLSPIDRLLTDIEVEARKQVDEMSSQLGEQPLWAQLDAYLAVQYPNRYNQPLSYFLPTASS